MTDAVQAREDVLAYIWLFTDWRFITSQMTTEERELWADAIDNSHARSDTDAAPVDRWWRDDQQDREMT